MKKFVLMILLFLLAATFEVYGERGEHEDHDEHDHGSVKAIGKGKAIEVVDEQRGFKLSEEAIKTLGIRLKNVNGGVFYIGKKTLVTSRMIKGIYRFREGFFKLLKAEILKERKGGYLVKVEGMNAGDQIVVSGVGVLRVADVYSTDKAEYGHSH
jgi:hypothetical protein